MDSIMLCSNRDSFISSFSGWITIIYFPHLISVDIAFKCCYGSVTKLSPTLSDPMDCSMTVFHILHCFPKFAQTNFCWTVIPSNYLILNMPAFGKFNSGHWTGKGQFSFQSQRKAMPKNAQTTAQLHSSHTLVK